MKVAISFIYYEAVTPTMYITDLNGKDWKSFLYGNNDERKNIACRVLKKETLQSSIREVSWIPLDDQDLLVEKNPVAREKRKLFFDMDGTLVDFESGIRKVSEEVLVKYANNEYDNIDGIFSLMDPMPGAIEAARTLNEYYDCHILSTSPWNNPTGCSGKMNWIKRYLGDVFYKKVTLTHHKEFLNDGESLLIDDRKTHGAAAFGKRLIEFDAKNPDWKGITEKLVKMAREEGVGL